MIADIATGHHAAADVLFLIAAIVFAVELVLGLVQDRPVRISLMPVGLALVAIAWLVL